MKSQALILAGMLTLIINVNAQENVGIGTLTPNPNAILDLSSKEKGMLVPRMTKAEKDSITIDTLVDAGLLVYDLTDSLFYFWNTHRWHPFPSPLSDGDWKIVGNNMYSEVSGNVGVGTTNPVTKFHTVGTLRFAGLATGTNNDVLTVAANGDVRYRTLGSDIWDGDAVNDADSNPTNECNSAMFFDSNTNRLTIVDACTTLTEIISINSNDHDPNPTNEIQNLSAQSNPLNGSVTINIDNGGTSTATFSIRDDDSNPANELQTLSITANPANDTVTWSLTQSGGSGSFSIDDNDWVGAGTGSLYPANLTDNVGIGTSTPAYKLDVNGNMRVSSRLYFNTTDYIERNALDLSFYSFNDMRFNTGSNDHSVRFYRSSGEAIVNFNQDGTDVMTLRGNGGSSTFSVGIGTAAPLNKLQVAGDVRVGLINPLGFTNGGNNYGNLIYFSGGPGNSANSDNNDLLFIARYNTGPNVSELRVGIGDDHTSSSESDRFSIGSYTSSNISNFQGLFDFEIKNPGTSTAPMLSISPFNTTHNKDYHGGVSVTKPSASGQYINLARGASTVWSLGYQYNTPHFAISEGNTNDAAFAVTAPFFTILSTSGNVGIGVASPTQKFQVSGNGLFSGTVTASCGVLVCSDFRFKKDIKFLTNSLDKIKMINGVRYNWRKAEFPERNFSDKEQIGFIAQDIESIIPEMVNTDETGYKTVDYAKITPVIVEAIKEQQELLEAEKAAHAKTAQELSELKSTVQALAGKFKSLEAELNKGKLTTEVR